VTLDETVAWGGRIVINTQEELHQAFDEFKHD
jgi:redox-sensitive bicupin YhaK (pirin superfamily)